MVKADKKHSMKFFTTRWFGEEFVQTYLDANWEPAQDRWSLAFTPKERGDFVSITPTIVEVSGKSMRLWYPLEILLKGGRLEQKNSKLMLNNIDFTLFVIDKEKGIRYSDDLEPTRPQKGFACQS